MSKPILTIADFQQGITYDETENTQNGFNDLSNIDIKSTLGIAQLSNLFVDCWANDFVPTNKMIEYSVLPDIALSWTTSSFLLSRGAWSSWRVYTFDSLSKSINLFYTSNSWNWVPIFSDMAIFQNRLFYPNDKSEIRSIWLWTSWQIDCILWNWTTTVALTDPFWNKIQPVDQSFVWGILNIWNTWTLVYDAVNIVSISWSNITLAWTIWAWTYKGYITAPVTGVKNSAWVTTAMSTPNKTAQYRPLIEFNWRLYVWDWDYIYNLDNTMTVWNTTQAQGAISIWSNYVVKQFEQIGGLMYILADEYNQNYNNTFFNLGGQPRSKLYIYDWVSDWFSSIIDIWAHCYWIKVAENRIYATIQSWNMDWVLFTYFNGSDFPTLAKFQVDNPNCPINCISYDRGRFFVTVNSFNASNQFQKWYIFTYAAYAIESMSVSKEYESPVWSTYQLHGIDYLKQSKQPLLLFFDEKSWNTSYLKYRDETKFVASGTIQTQKYEITWNQFWQLVRWVQVNCKELMPTNTTITIKWRWDEETSFSTLTGTITSANQNAMIWGINRRYKKIQIQVILATSDWLNTPKPVKIMLF